MCLQVLGEAVLSPAIPSVAARAGGIFFPLAKVGCWGNCTQHVQLMPYCYMQVQHVSA